MTTCSSAPRPCTRTQTVWPSSSCGTEYSPASNLTIGILAATVRGRPNARVCGSAGTVPQLSVGFWDTSAVVDPGHTLAAPTCSTAKSFDVQLCVRVRRPGAFGLCQVVGVISAKPRVRAERALNGSRRSSLGAVKDSPVRLDGAPGR